MYQNLCAKEIKKLIKITGIEKTIETPPDPKFGDFSTTIAFELAREQKKSPMEIANSIASKIQIPRKSLIKKIEVKGPYINFFVNYGKLAEVIMRDVLKGKFHFKPEKNRIMVEHTSVNPNKAIHIGHARNSCLGDSIAKILNFLGNDVQIANYIDDSGTQLADILVGFEFLGFPLKTKRKFDHYCGNEVYVKVNVMYEKNPELKKKRQFVIKKIEEGKNKYAKSAEKITNRVLKAQLETLWKLGIYYNLLNMETDIIKFKFWGRAFSLLKKRNYVYYAKSGPNEGCWLLKLSHIPKFKKLKEPDKILLRSDGTVVYAAKDIAYAMWKHGLIKEDFNYTKYLKQPNEEILWKSALSGKSKLKFGDVQKSVNVIDVRQSYEQEVVSTVIDDLSRHKKDYTHYAYEVVSLSKDTAKELKMNFDKSKKFIHMSGRKGMFINADDVLDLLQKKAYSETKKRNPEAKEKWLKETAKKISIGALRYELTKVDKDKIIVFDMNQALRLDGNTAPYLQYTYARAKRILEKSKKETFSFHVPEKMENIESELVKSLSNFISIVKKSGKELNPRYLCLYAYEISTLFNKFYQDCPVLNSDEKIKNFRLSLVNCFVIVLKNTLDMIGVPAIEKM